MLLRFVEAEGGAAVAGDMLVMLLGRFAQEQHDGGFMNTEEKTKSTYLSLQENMQHIV